MNEIKNPADSGASLSNVGLGRIAYEAAAAATGCTQPWEEANQAKWDAAALAVAEAEREVWLQQAKRVRNYSAPDDVFEAVPVRVMGGERSNFKSERGEPR